MRIPEAGCRAATERGPPGGLAAAPVDQLLHQEYNFQGRFVHSLPAPEGARRRFLTQFKADLHFTAYTLEGAYRRVQASRPDRRPGVPVAHEERTRRRPSAAGRRSRPTDRPRARGAVLACDFAKSIAESWLAVGVTKSLRLPASAEAGDRTPDQQSVDAPGADDTTARNHAFHR